MIKKYAIYEKSSGSGRRLVSMDEADLSQQIRPDEAFVEADPLYFNPNFRVEGDTILPIAAQEQVP